MVLQVLEHWRFSAGLDFSAAPGEDCGRAHFHSCSLWICPKGRCIRGQHVPEDASGAVNVEGSLHRSRFSAGTVSRVGPLVEQSVSEGMHLVEWTHIGEVHQKLYHMGGTLHWSRGLYEEEGVAEKSYYGPTSTPIPCPPCTTWGEEEVEELSLFIL